MDGSAFFFGSSDWGNSITVDKPPLSLWLMGLSVRVFGFSPTAMLLPQVAMGVGTTLLIYLTLRHSVSAVAAFLASVVFCFTPIVTLMSRYNNPDPLMLFLMVAAAWFVVKGNTTGRGRWFIVTGGLLGLAFMTKQLQGLISLPALGMAYLLFSPASWKSRVRTSIFAGGALVVTGGSWMTIVDLIPAENRPFVGGSISDSVLELTFAYNGIGRVLGGAEAPKPMAIPSQYSTVDSDAGFLRLLNANYNQEASWLLFGTLLAAIVLITRWKKLPRTAGFRTLVVISVGWLITAFVLLSFMGDQLHTYYTAALAPPIALTVGVFTDEIIRNANERKVRLSGSAVALSMLLTSWLILGGLTGWPDWLPGATLILGILSLSALAVKPPTIKVDLVAACLLLVSVLCGPVITSVHNVAVTFSGSNPWSGVLTKNPSGISHMLDAMKTNQLKAGHDIAFGRDPDWQVTDALKATSTCRWAAATSAGQTAARLQLESNRPVMPIGGFAGIDPSPTLEEFKAKVSRGEICYFIQQEAIVAVQEPNSEGAAISKWVQANFSSERLGGTTVVALRQDRQK
ncbi:glycosyltransferase family 39 protein [Pseudarthrobacter equi]|uniref:glycosyltransferase family 39 protein n=1 Tax=Pseudarthrobacter equi TaxID=728066 RepID=UPI0028D8FFB7|nr:glycosyltransferase family 39 protein [Pseudarthrobacter equi]